MFKFVQKKQPCRISKNLNVLTVNGDHLDFIDEQK